MSSDSDAYTMTLNQMQAQEAVARAGAFIFNPPTASAMPDSDAHVTSTPERLPYELQRVAHTSFINIRTRRTGPRPVKGQEDTRPQTHYVPCKRASSTRNPCPNDITIYKVHTGSRLVEATHDQGSYMVDDYVYFWPDDAIIVERGGPYNTRPAQQPFCTYKCLSLWAAKQSRDIE